MTNEYIKDGGVIWKVKSCKSSPYEIERNTAYSVGDILTSPSLPPGYIIVVTTAGTTGNSEPDWSTAVNNLGG